MKLKDRAHASQPKGRGQARKNRFKPDQTGDYFVVAYWFSNLLEEYSLIGAIERAANLLKIEPDSTPVGVFTKNEYGKILCVGLALPGGEKIVLRERPLSKETTVSFLERMRKEYLSNRLNYTVV